MSIFSTTFQNFKHFLGSIDLLFTQVFNIDTFMNILSDLQIQITVFELSNLLLFKKIIQDLLFIRYKFQNSLSLYKNLFAFLFWIYSLCKINNQKHEAII